MTITCILRPTSFLTLPRHSYLTTTNRYPRLRHFATQAEPTHGKLKTFMKKYGYVGVGVYLGFSVVDLGLTMGLIHVKGADKVEQLEHWVISTVQSTLGIATTAREEKVQQQQQQQQEHQPSWTSIFVLAYGIHKTILLPFRLSLTAAVTPTVARKLVSLGWIQRRSLPKATR